jgi:hypothetical protein
MRRGVDGSANFEQNNIIMATPVRFRTTSFLVHDVDGCSRCHQPLSGAVLRLCLRTVSISCPVRRPLFWGLFYVCLRTVSVSCPVRRPRTGHARTFTALVNLAQESSLACARLYEIAKIKFQHLRVLVPAIVGAGLVFVTLVSLLLEHPMMVVLD